MMTVFTPLDKSSFFSATTYSSFDGKNEPNSSQTTVMFWQGKVINHMIAYGTSKSFGSHKEADRFEPIIRAEFT